ncbi:MAG: hypothetical protein KC493_00360 [Bacteriovoracaceae bacterium]|nr:hypothetical protein [Bacteriovoracaceae bacterium]
MLSRKEHQEKPNHLPDEWKKKVTELLISIYGDKFDQSNFEFHIFGMTYPSEMLLTVSLVNTKDESAAPVTYHVSADLDEKTKADKTIAQLVDSIGIFFDNYFDDPEWNDFFSKWEETTFKGSKLFYKITRENIGLTILADQILDSDNKVH